MRLFIGSEIISNLIAAKSFAGCGGGGAGNGGEEGMPPMLAGGMVGGAVGTG